MNHVVFESYITPKILVGFGKFLYLLLRNMILDILFVSTWNYMIFIRGNLFFSIVLGIQ